MSPSPIAHLLQQEQPSNPFLTVSLTWNQGIPTVSLWERFCSLTTSSNADSETSQACLFFLLILSLLSGFTIFSIQFDLLFNVCSHSFCNSWIYSCPVGLYSLNPLMLYPLSSHWNLLLELAIGAELCSVFHVSYFSKLWVRRVTSDCWINIFLYNSYILYIAMFSVFK